MSTPAGLEATLAEILDWFERRLDPPDYPGAYYAAQDALDQLEGRRPLGERPREGTPTGVYRVAPELAKLVRGFVACACYMDGENLRVCPRCDLLVNIDGTPLERVPGHAPARRIGDV